MQLFACFFMIRIGHNAVNRANILALRRIVMADAFGAFIGVYFVNFFALRDGVVRAFRLAHIAVNTIFGNQKSHNFPFPEQFNKADDEQLT